MGKCTVIYGHNGSGKSTLAELLLSLAEGDAAEGVVWESDDRGRVAVRRGGESPSPAMAVFTRAWVHANLQAFLEGESAEAIVTLGQAAIDSKEQEQQLEREIDDLRTEAMRCEDVREKVSQSVARLAREVQDRIVADLQPFNYAYYTKSRYSIPKVSEALRAPRTGYRDAGAHRDALGRMKEGAPTAVTRVDSAPIAPSEELTSLGGILERTPTRVALASLEDDPDSQRWVEQGLSLHQQREYCLFCDGALTANRRQELANHFDESWLEIRRSAQELLRTVTGYASGLRSWLASLPEAVLLSGDLQPTFQRALEQAKRDVDRRLADLESVAAALSSKVNDPSSTPEVPGEIEEISVPMSVTILSEAVQEHNARVRQHSDLKAQWEATILDHIVGSSSQTFRDLEKQAADASKDSETSAKSAQLAEIGLERVRQQRFTTKEMADKLTKDLARVYGKEHLRIVVTDDGKSYACRRGDKAGTDLSEGERTTLSLLYFLRTLEDQQAPGGDPANRIVVIDDPSSSLDREALFATHQWLFSTLKGFGQYVVLTHDFNLLRLFISSHSNKWSTSIKAISEGNQDEARFPRVAFLEMFAATVDGKRTTKMGELPRLLRNSTSEYAYLFHMLVKGVIDSADHERLFLLPNAARRVLEVFASYKAPHRPNFLQQLEVLVQNDPDEPFRDVYDFCNRYSHGEGSETVEVLDARAVHSQIRRCVEFLRAVDADHFHNMCVAVNVDPNSIPG